ncbi:MAG: ComF family protein, partial [Anaerolineae bacterium]
MTAGVRTPDTTWRSRVKHLADAVVNFVFPPTCASCNAPGSLFCADCLEKVSWLKEPLCPRCGRIVSRPTDCCSSCRSRALPLRQMRAAVLFADPIPPVIHKLKYHSLYALAEPLAALMVTSWSQWALSADLIIPIPLHAARLRERGFNQSELIARHLSRQVNIPCDPA